MIPVHIALVDDTASIEHQTLAEVAGALNAQIQQDFAPVYRVAATVGAYPRAPANTWAVHIKRQLDEPGALGYHADAHNQPFARVELTDGWPATVSHEVLEMLADPFGNRLHGGRVPQGIDHHDVGLPRFTSHVSYLLEACDPCEATSYEVGGVALSDFLVPAGWYRANPAPGHAYSHAGGCTQPRQVADGGYVSFAHGPSWFQVFNEAGALQLQSIGTFNRGLYASLREFTDYHARTFRAR
ncbi:MAG: hypothetical protein QOG35_1629 [Solirubrobacteraceae bacterium]|jgi:hypothetical protein|nr:hypothetical protein [Solirubrobacteraceae bacterium]